jgi:hypothetical protein
VSALDALTTPLSLSLLTATRGNASKRLIADANGHPVKDPAHSLSIAAGYVEHVQAAGLMGFRDLLQRITPQQALVHGIPIGSNPGDVLTLVTAERYTGVPSSIARTLDCIDYPPGVRLLMCDYDPAPEAPETVASASELVTCLARTWPAFANAGWLATTSTSSAIRCKKTGDWLRPPEGMHVYMLAAGDVGRFRDVLKVRLWLAGTGYCKLATPNKHTGVASILERCLIDMTVFSAERLDFVAGAKSARNSPFYQDRPAPELHPGMVLDLDAFPDVTAEEREDYARLLGDARACVAPEQRAKVRVHITTATPALPDTEVEKEVITRIEQAERGELDPGQPLYFSNGTTCTAGTLTKALDGKRLCDPLEPGYAPSQACFHWRGGDWRIVSWAHGVKRVYQLALPAPEPPLSDDRDMDDLLTRVGDADDLDGLAAGARQHDTHGLISPYRMTPHGLVWDKPTKDGTADVLLTNFGAHITADILVDDGVETRHHYALAVQLNGQTHCLEILATQLAGMNWVAEHLGARAIVMPGMTLKDHARAAIQLLSPQVEHRRIYAHLGWRKRGEDWYYLHAGGAIGAQGAVEDITVALSPPLTAYHLPVPPTGEAAHAAIRTSLALLDVAPDSVTIPLYAGIWRAALGNIDCSLHLYGPTGEGKTELAALAQQHAGAGMDARNLPASWMSTGNALEGLAFLAKDAVMVVDDFCPTGARADIQRYHREADRLPSAPRGTKAAGVACGKTPHSAPTNARAG